MKTIELTDDCVDAIVIAELKDAFERNLIEDMNECGDPLGHDDQLLMALKVVLKYFMHPSEIDDYFAQHIKQYIKSYD